MKVWASSLYLGVTMRITDLATSPTQWSNIFIVFISSVLHLPRSIFTNLYCTCMYVTHACVLMHACLVFVLLSVIYVQCGVSYQQEISSCVGLHIYTRVRECSHTSSPTCKVRPHAKQIRSARADIIRPKFLILRSYL